MSTAPEGSPAPGTDPAPPVGSPLPPEHGSSSARAHRTVLPYALSITAASAALQLSIVATGNRITPLSMLLLLAIAVGYATYLVVFGRPLSQVRYGLFTVHAISYAAINAGFLLHAYVLVGISAPAIVGDSPLALSPEWLGATYGMAGFWGLGLLLHGLGATRSRGFERTRA